MDPTTRETIRAAEESVSRLVEQCGKSHRLYRSDPKLVAQVGRTGKRHLNTIANLRKLLDAPGDEGDKRGA
jgi:hypothetical protein